MTHDRVLTNQNFRRRKTKYHQVKKIKFYLQHFCISRSYHNVFRVHFHVSLYYVLCLPCLASVMAPHNSMIKSSVKPNASKSELSTASAKSIELVLFRPRSHIWKRIGEQCDYQFIKNRNFHLSSQFGIIDSHKRI